ncbi:MAG: hypothetical protein ACR2NS_14760 [Gemmatimonadaceae bacterium]
MRRLGQFLMGLGAALGSLVGIAIAVHAGAPNASWLINVALAKLSLIAAGGLMGAGAVAVRIDNRNRAREVVEHTAAKELPTGDS